MDIQVYKNNIEEKIEQYFDNLELPTQDKIVIEAVKNLKEFTLRPAKRLRPILMVAAYKCFKDDDKIVESSISIELMHSSLLIHDDIMDRDELRRGGKTIHKIYEEERDPNYGVSMAINLGNFSATLMLEIINKSGFDIKTKFKAYNKIIEVYKKENCGQTMDVGNFDRIISLNKLEELYLLKTVPYTTTGPLELGCIFAKGDYSKFGDYGNLVGFAFQIKDDLLGIFGDPSKTGKSNFSDIKEGKLTYPILYSLENCDDDLEKDIILESLGKKDISEERLEDVKGIIRKTSLDEMNKIISNNIENAKSGLNTSLRKEGLDVLIEIANMIGNRNS